MTSHGSDFTHVKLPVRIPCVMNPYPETLTHNGCGIVRRDSYVNARIFTSNISAMILGIHPENLS